MLKTSRKNRNPWSVRKNSEEDLQIARDMIRTRGFQFFTRGFMAMLITLVVLLALVQMAAMAAFLAMGLLLTVAYAIDTYVIPWYMQEEVTHELKEERRWELSMLIATSILAFLAFLAF